MDDRPLEGTAPGSELICYSIALQWVLCFQLPEPRHPTLLQVSTLLTYLINCLINKLT